MSYYSDLEMTLNDLGLTFWTFLVFHLENNILTLNDLDHDPKIYALQTQDLSGNQVSLS